MKKLLFILLLSPLFSLAQYRESGDTIFVNNKILVPGDTLHLGMGSDPYKNFVFVYAKPTVLNAKVVDGQVILNYLNSTEAFNYFIYGGMDFKGKKQIKYGGLPYFYLAGNNKPRNTYFIKVLPALTTKEILL